MITYNSHPWIIFSFNRLRLNHHSNLIITEIWQDPKYASEELHQVLTFTGKCSKVFNRALVLKISQNIEESTGLMYEIKNEDVNKDYNSNKEILVLLSIQLSQNKMMINMKNGR